MSLDIGYCNDSRNSIIGREYSLPISSYSTPLALMATTNQRDGSFGLYMPKANQKNRPFGLRFMWFA